MGFVEQVKNAAGSSFGSALGSSLGSGVASVGRGLFGGLLGLFQQKSQNEFNAQEAQKNRDWQEYMSNTAFQRQVKDMMAAGVNPALLYGSGSDGASTPSGGQASAAGFNAIQDALAIGMQQAQISNLNSQTEKNLADADLTSRNAAWVDKLNEGTLNEIQSRLGLNAAQINALDYDNAVKKAQELQILKENEWIDRVNSAKTAADKAKAAYDFAEAAISQYEKQIGHRMSSSELLAVVDSIANALRPGETPGEVATEIVDSVISAGKEYLKEHGEEIAGVVAGPAGRRLYRGYKDASKKVTGFLKHVSDRSYGKSIKESGSR